MEADTRKNIGKEKESVLEKEKEKLFLQNSLDLQMSDEKKLAVYRSCGGRIESVRELGLDEKILLAGIRNGYNVYYTLYTYRLNTEEQLRKFEENLEHLYEQSPIFRSLYQEVGQGEYVCLIGRKRKSVFSVYDISERQERDKKIIFQNFLLKERKNKYNPFVKCLLHANVFKLYENEYICVLSLCEQGEGLKKKKAILNTLFQTDEYEQMENSMRANALPVFTSASYWKSVLHDLPEQPLIPMQHQNNGIGSEIFVLDDELAKLMDTFSKESGIELKELFLTIWGIVFCRFYNLPEMVIGDAEEEGILTVAPIRIRQTADMKRLLFDIQSQLRERKKHTGYSLEEYRQKQNVDLAKGVYIIQNFNESAENKLIRMDFPAGRIYRVKPYSIPEVPLQIDYNISSLLMRMVYTYNRRMFDNTDIGKFHEVFQKLAKGMLEIIRDKFDVSIEEVAEQAMKVDTSKLIMNKTVYLNKSKLFTSYELEEMLIFTQKCRLVDYQMGEVIMEEQSRADYLYIVAKGRVEVNRTNGDSYLAPVQILKEGNVFGMESLTKDAFTNNQYVAYSDTVKLLEIPYSTLRNEMEHHPTMLLDFIEYQSKELNKFQTLWIME